MAKVPLTDFGRKIKHRLDDADVNQTQTWLIEQVHNDTGLFFDDSYLFKIMRGRSKNPTMIASICKILNLGDPAQYVT